MTSLILALALAANPDAGVPAWTITHEFSSGSDVGNGKIYATENMKTVVTPVDGRRTTENMFKGKKTKTVIKPKPLSPEVRDAIAALLPTIPTEDATFSNDPFVNDEGWVSSSISVERDGKKATFTLKQGKGDPVPASVDELLKLVGKALR